MLVGSNSGDIYIFFGPDTAEMFHFFKCYRKPEDCKSKIKHYWCLEFPHEYKIEKVPVMVARQPECHYWQQKKKKKTQTKTTTNARDKITRIKRLHEVC